MMRWSLLLGVGWGLGAMTAGCSDSTTTEGGGSGGSGTQTTTSSSQGGAGGGGAQGGSGATGAQGGSGATGGQGGSGATGAQGGAAGQGGGNGGHAGAAACDEICQQQGLSCCDGSCVATYNDIFNCGSCNNTCAASPPYCNGQMCVQAPCNGGAICSNPQLCCGSECCQPGQLCCSVPGPGPSLGPQCHDPVNGTCPIGCPLCN